MKSRDKKITSGKLLTAAVLLIFLIYVIYQLFAILMPFTTGTAVYYSAFDGINTTGTIVRSETVLTSDIAGEKYFVVGDGEKVSKDGIIANVYNSREEADIYTQIGALSERIADLTEVQSYNNTTAVNLELLNGRIDDTVCTLVSACADGIFIDGNELSDELLMLMSRKKIAVGEEQDYQAFLAELSAQHAALSASAPAAVSAIRSTESGYFVSTADGFEELLNSDTVMTLTPETLASLTPTVVGENTVGKIVSDYTWFIACTVPLEKSAAFKVGDEVTIKTTLKSAGTLSATVSSVNLGNGDSAVMVFSCRNMNGELASIRTLPLTLVTGEYSGLRVSNRAIRVVDGKTGVYVISGMQAKFAEVKILHSANGFTICEAGAETDGGLRLYDEVIEKGRNLYDGKIIR